MASVIPRKGRPYDWQLAVYVPLDHRHASGGRRTMRRDVHRLTRQQAQAEAEKWEHELYSKWGVDMTSSRRRVSKGKPTQELPYKAFVVPAAKTQDARTATLNDLVREAHDAQEQFDQFDCDTVARPGDMIKLRQLTSEWDKANLKLVRFVVRHGEDLIRDLGGRVAQKDKEALVET